jgi:hypothetical protein
MKETEKPNYEKEGMYLGTFLKTDKGKKVKKLYQVIDECISDDPCSYISCGALEEVIKMIMRPYLCQKQQ